MIQRYMALKDVKTARKGQLIYVTALTLMIYLCAYNGLLLYATYHDCDPLTTKLAKAKDQLVPLLVMDILKDLPGLPGLFISGIFSGALSSLSTDLNSMSGVVLEDFVKPFVKDGVSERTSSYIMRGTVLGLGTLAVCLVNVVQHLGTVLQLSMSLPTACFGAMLGVYIVGFTLPWIGKRAVLYGTILGCISTTLLVLKAQAEMARGSFNFGYKEMSVEGCSYNFTTAESNTTMLESSTVFLEVDDEKHFYQISYVYYTFFGSLIVVISSCLLSFIFGFQDPNEVDPKLMAPFMRKYFKSKVAQPVELTFRFNDEKN